MLVHGRVVGLFGGSPAPEARLTHEKSLCPRAETRRQEATNSNLASCKPFRVPTPNFVLPFPQSRRTTLPFAAFADMCCLPLLLASFR